MKIFTKKSKTKNGIKETLWIDFSHNGKRYRKSLKLNNTKANKIHAETVILPQLQLKVASGEFFNNAKVTTLDEFSVLSFKIHSSSRKLSTINDYKGAYKRYIKPTLGHIRINAFKPSILQAWQNDLPATLSPSRVKTLRTILSSVFKDALKDEIIDKNPLSLVKAPTVLQTDIQPFSIQEMNQIISCAQGMYKNLFALAFYTGIRSGELIGLKWSDIDMERKEINISRTIKNGIISTPKTNNSIRTVEIIDVLMPYLKEQYKLTGNYNSYVFLNQNNTHIYDIKRIRDTHWKKVLKACDITYRPIYHTRHTFATMMLENGEDMLWVSSMLGHKDAYTTLSHYAKYINRRDKNRAQFLNIE